VTRTHVCHLVDGHSGWEERIAIEQLVDRLGRDHFTTTVAALGARGTFRVAGDLHSATVMAHSDLPALFAAPDLARFVSRNEIHVVHAWGLRAAVAATTARVPHVIYTPFDPHIADKRAKVVRTLCRQGNLALACPTQIVQRRLVEGGVPVDRCVVIRPGIDFGRVNRIRRGPLRQELGLTRGEHVIAVPPLESSSDYYFEGYMAGRLINQLEGGVQVLMRESDARRHRLPDLDRGIGTPKSLVTVPDSVSSEELVAIADSLVLPARGDISTPAIAWAMAAGTLVVGSATYSIAELIAHKVNGLLFKLSETGGTVVKIVNCLRERQASMRVIEAARSQAYEVFSLRRFIEQTERLYNNMISGDAPSEGVTDAAAVG